MSATEPVRGEKHKVLYAAAVILVSLLYLGGLIGYAQRRPIDGDEGFYITAARLVWEGKVPYRDFFYQQAPLLPYLYSWIWALRPGSLVAMRMLSATCGGLTVLLWGACLLWVKRLPTKISIATFAVVLLNPYWVSWNVVVKTFALTNLMMSVAMISLYAALHSERLRWFFIAGLALGACAAVRSLYGPLIPVVLGWVLYRQGPREKGSYLKTGGFLAGALCGLAPMIVSFTRDPRAFIFNNVTYHGLQAGYIWADGKGTVGYHSVEYAILVYFAQIVICLLGYHPYFTIELLLAIVGVRRWRRLREKRDSPYDRQDRLYFDIAFLMLLTYIVTALIPFPPYSQYFDSPLVPFLIPFIAEGLHVVFQLRRRGWVWALAIMAPVLFWVEIPGETAMFTTSSSWEMSSSRRVAQAIEANSAPGDAVLSFWPGYVYQSGRNYFPGMEDQFVYRILSRISHDDRERYHIVSKDQVLNALSTRAVSVIVLVPRVQHYFDAPWMLEYYDNLSPEEIRAFLAVLDANYSLVARVGEVAVYRRR
jgi:hypothetical protein